MSASATGEVSRIPRPIIWRWVIRIIVVVVMALLAWLVLWSYFGRFLPAHRLFVQKTTTQLNLANEVQQLMLKWDDLDAAQTGKKFELASASIFGSASECESWLENLRRGSLTQALNVTSKLGKADTNAHPELGLILQSATVEIQPVAAPGFSNGPYHRLLGFANSLEQASKRTDLLELTVSGQSNSVDRASAAFQLWSRSSPPK
jgi:hypothetical protein